MNRNRHCFVLVAPSALALFVVLTAVALNAQTERVLISFAGGSSGNLPFENGLISDVSGNLYGATYRGNNVFELIKPTGTIKNWTLSPLLTLTGTFPNGKLLFDKNGNLYGATLTGGQGAGGTIFQLSNSGGTWTETILFNFDFGANSATGSQPHGDLAMDGKGNLYGTTFEGGTNSAGVIFELSPPTGGVGSWTEQILYNFSIPTGGNPLNSGVIFSNGNLFGTTYYGGANSAGVAYELSPPSGGTGPWVQTVLHNFGPVYSTDGSLPQGGLIIDASGNLYGTTSQGGTFGRGTVFELSPLQTGGWTEKILYNFTGSADGYNPVAGVVQDKSGNLYGVTNNGGSAAANLGTLFKLAPGASWTFSILYQFAGGADGANPSAALQIDPSGSLYGTTTNGGAACNCGTIYKVVP